MERKKKRQKSMLPSTEVYLISTVIVTAHSILANESGEFVKKQKAS